MNYYELIERLCNCRDSVDVLLENIVLLKIFTNNDVAYFEKLRKLLDERLEKCREYHKTNTWEWFNETENSEI